MNKVAKSPRKTIISISPREAYELIKSHRRGNAPVEKVDIGLSGLVIFNRYVPKGTESFYVATTDELGAVIDAGVIARHQPNPDLLVFSPMDAVSYHTLKSLGEPVAGGVLFRERELILKTTLEDRLKFGDNWSEDERDYVLQEAVNEHYKTVGQQQPIQLNHEGAKLAATLPSTPKKY